MLITGNLVTPMENYVDGTWKFADTKLAILHNTYLQPHIMLVIGT